MKFGTRFGKTLLGSIKTAQVNQKTDQKMPGKNPETSLGVCLSLLLLGSSVVPRSLQFFKLNSLKYDCLLKIRE
jgi:hypothetical protein